MSDNVASRTRKSVHSIPSNPATNSPHTQDPTYDVAIRFAMAKSDSLFSRLVYHVLQQMGIKKFRIPKSLKTPKYDYKHLGDPTFLDNFINLHRRGSSKPAILGIIDGTVYHIEFQRVVHKNFDKRMLHTHSAIATNFPDNGVISIVFGPKFPDFIDSPNFIHCALFHDFHSPDFLYTSTSSFEINHKDETKILTKTLKKENDAGVGEIIAKKDFNGGAIIYVEWLKSINNAVNTPLKSFCGYLSKNYSLEKLGKSKIPKVVTELTSILQLDHDHQMTITQCAEHMEKAYRMRPDLSIEEVVSLMSVPAYESIDISTKNALSRSIKVDALSVFQSETESTSSIQI